MNDPDSMSTESSAQEPTSQNQSAAPAWRPLTARQRRVLGTLMEKSKTTPDAYPMTMLGLTTGCNQKSNRSPINNYSQEQIEESVDQLREIGALAIVQGNGRVSKVRHYGYQWLGINKVEAAVMTELLLRGEQTVGELRTRASRMEPIQDLGELQNILEGLRQKKLIISLTPQGRGQVVSHNLYQDHELDQLKQAVAAGVSTMPNDDEPAAPTTSRATSSYTSASSSSASSSTSITSELEELRKMVMKLNARVSYLEEQLGLNSASDSSPSE